MSYPKNFPGRPCGQRKRNSRPAVQVGLSARWLQRAPRAEARRCRKSRALDPLLRDPWRLALAMLFPSPLPLQRPSVLVRSPRAERLTLERLTPVQTPDRSAPPRWWMAVALL